MQNELSKNPVDFCESILRSEIADNTADRIWPNDINIICHRLLDRQAELTKAYSELCKRQIGMKSPLGVL
ncbi:MAG: hypothetical protein R3D29_13890 [Nitratireductor sp.]